MIARAAPLLLLLILSVAACQQLGRSYTSPSGFPVFESRAPDDTPACPPDATVTVGVVIALPDERIIDTTRPFPENQLAEHAVVRDAPLTFALRDAVPGLRELITGMRVNQTRSATIPPEHAYGAEGRPPRVPPNTPLLYEVTLLAFETP